MLCGLMLIRNLVLSVAKTARCFRPSSSFTCWGNNFTSEAKSWVSRDENDRGPQAMDIRVIGPAMSVVKATRPKHRKQAKLLWKM